jgi:hypothetical protein
MRDAATGVIDTTLDVEEAATWIMGHDRSRLPASATSERFDRSRQLPTLRRTIHGLVSP